MRNYLAEGKTISLIAPVGGVTAGVPVIVGGVFAIPIASASAGASFVGYVEGVYTIAKATGFTAAAGDKAYWNATALNLTSDTTDALIGVYYAAAASGDTTASVRLNGTSIQAAAAAASAGVMTTGYVSCTGLNNVSSVPTTFTYMIGRVDSGKVLTECDLFGTLGDETPADISGATYTVIIDEDGTQTELESFTAPTEEVNVSVLSPEYTVSGTTNILFVEVSGLADASNVVFKADVLFE